MADRPEAMAKEQLAQRMADAYNGMERLLATLDAAQMTRPEVYEGLSVKDVLAHMAAWLRMSAEWIETSLRGEAPVVYAPGFLAEGKNWEAVMHRLNAHIYRQNKDRRLDDVLAEFRAAHTHMMELVRATPERDLIEAGRFDWFSGRPIWILMAENSYEHYQEHQELIEAWLDRGDA
jgi:hypothetical protein